MVPTFIDVFLAPVRDNLWSQVSITALMLLILLDWCFGVGNALGQHKFSSERMRQGIGHKCTELGFVMVGIIADGLLFAGLDIGFNGPVLVAIALYLCVMEIGSLLETFADMNPHLADTAVFKLLESVHVVEPEDTGAKHAA